MQPLTTRVLGGVLAIGLAATLGAQAPGVHPVSGRRFAPVMGYQGADWLERNEREDEEAPDVALTLLRIPKGASVADIGAGSGYITVKLAARVGSTGQVFANDVQPQMLEMLARKLSARHIRNVTLVQGTLDDPKLPPASVDLELMVDVYHEFSQPQVRHLREARSLPAASCCSAQRRIRIPIKPEHKMTSPSQLESRRKGSPRSRRCRGGILIFTVKP
jgi:SAM-dependent methyltransferase